MIKRLDATNAGIAVQILDVQIPSYRTEAKLIGFADLPPLRDTIQTLQQCEETFFGYYEENELCGVISVRVENRTADIHRLIVHPDHFRKGIAQSLLDFIEKELLIEAMRVSTGALNVPAVHFYEKNGFRKVKEVYINEQLTLASFEKNT